jgi:hypothetical protein
MAKLSANSTENARYVRIADKSTLDKHVLDAKTEISFRDNGRVLRKHVTWFIDVYTEKGYRRVDHGWKRWARIENKEQRETLVASLLGAGYTKVEGKK